MQCLFFVRNTFKDCIQEVGDHVYGDNFSIKYTACHTDENGIKPGSNLNIADKRVANPSRAELLGMK